MNPQRDDQDLIEEEEMEEGIQEVDADTDALRIKTRERFNRIQVNQILKAVGFRIKETTKIKTFRTTISVFEIKVSEDGSIQDFRDAVQDGTMGILKEDSEVVKFSKETNHTRASFAISKA